MMFSLTFAVFILTNLGVNGHLGGIQSTFGTNPPNGYSFGKLRLTEDGQNEVIPVNNTEIVQSNQDQVPVVAQPLPSPCAGAPPLTKLSYAKDRTKYIQCRDEYHYEIFTCPNGGEYNQEKNSCDLIVQMIDTCEQEKPCLNDGKCTLLPNSGFKCTCQKYWTGEKCETPINSCAKKPCGPNADCRPLKTTGTEQDFACVCNEIGGYGLNCQEAVPDPCLSSGGEQFFPFIFSQHAYIQCDGDLLHFQPCGPLLYWNQEEKICDRKRPPKVNLPALIAKLRTQFNQPETTTLVDQNGNDGIEGVFAFIPAKIANRQQLQADFNNQQAGLSQTAFEIGKKAQELAKQLSQAVDMRQSSTSNNQQWTNSQIDAILKQSQNIQSGQNQMPTKNNQQWMTTLTDGSNGNSNLGTTQFRQDNQQQQNFQNQNQVFASQPSFNQVSDINSQNNQRFFSQPQSDQKSQTLQGQTRFLDQIQSSLSDGSATNAQNTMNLNAFQNSNIRDQSQSWQNRPATQMTENQTPQSNNFNAQGTQTLTGQPQMWQNQQQFMETTTSAPNMMHLQAFQNSNTQDQQRSWQNRPANQMTVNQTPQSGNFNAQMSQTFSGQPQTWQTSSMIQNQGRLSGQNQATFPETTTSAPTVIRLQGFQNPQTNQLSGNQFLQPNNFMNQNAQTSFSQSTSGQNSQSFQNPQTLSLSVSGGSTLDNKNLLGMQLNSQPSVDQQNAQNTQSWQTNGNTQIRVNVKQPEGTTVDVQQLPLTNANMFTNQNVQTQQRLPAMNSQTSLNLNNGQMQQGIQTSIKKDNQPQSQQNFGQQNPRMIGQGWQASQSMLNQQPVPETTTAQPNIIHLQGFQAPKTQDQGVSWQSKFSNQQTQTDFSKQQPQQWTNNNLQSMGSISSQTNQLGLNQQQAGTGVQMTATFDQTKPRSNTQQYSSQGNLMTGSNDMKLQNNQPFAVRPLTTYQTQGSSQTGPLLAYTYETTTMANRMNNWQPMPQQYSNQVFDQRKPLDSVPALPSGSWPSRS